MTTATPVLDTEIDFILDDLPDVAGTLREFRAQKPAIWARAFGAPTLMLLSHELVHAAFKDEDTFPSAAFYSNVVTDVLGRNLQCMYSEEHRINRALVSPAFRQRLMPGLVQPLLEPLAHELIDRFESTGEADLVADFTSRYPFMIITRLLGLPRHSEEEIRRWAINMLDIQMAHDGALRASQEFVAFVTPILEERRGDPGDDLLSTLATTEVEGERLTDEEIFNFLKLLFPAGADTTYLGLGNTIYHLLTNPDQLDLVMSDLGEECRWAGEEALRMDPPTAWIPRVNPEEISWHGIDVPAGAPMMFGIMAANRDPAAYDDPDTYDITRRPQLVMTFGHGVHFCLGAHLARAELQVALQVILERLPNLRFKDTDGVRITGTIHHLLRGPNRLPVTWN